MIDDASLPDSFSLLVAALEASSEYVPKMEVVTEHLLHRTEDDKEQSSE